MNGPKLVSLSAWPESVRITAERKPPAMGSTSLMPAKPVRGPRDGAGWAPARGPKAKAPVSASRVARKREPCIGSPGVVRVRRLEQRGVVLVPGRLVEGQASQELVELRQDLPAL